MELTLKMCILFILLSAFAVTNGNSLHVIGHTEEDFQTDLSYITRFVFRPNVMGRLQYSMKIPANDCCSDLVLFNGMRQQWPLIRDYGHDMTCFEKLDVIPGIQSTIYPLVVTSGIHRCEFMTETSGEEKLHCFGDRRFRHPDPQWYYFTFMNCHYRSHSGINVTYDLHMTNGHEGALIEFSADEDANLPVTLTCDAILLACMLCGFVYGVILFSRKMLHTTYKIWFLSLCLHFTGCVIMSVAWYKFAWDGVERKKEVALGHYFTSAGSIVFAVLMIVISKGYTITRLTIRSIGKLKIGAFTCWFSFCYMVLYIILGQTDPRDVKNIYDTPAALGIVGMRIGACMWCLYGAFFTIKDFPLKRAFYLIFAILSSSWFLAEPVMILFSNFWLPLHCRAKWVHAVYLITLVFGHVVFVLLTRPSATNIYFPFHLSTNKVGIEEDVEKGMSYKYVPTEATFTNFLAVRERPAELKISPNMKETKSASSSLFSEKQPSMGRFDLFMATSERAKMQQKEKVSSPVPSISASVSMTTEISCPVPSPSNLPVTTMASESASTGSVGKEDDWAELVLENLDEPNENCDQKMDSSKVVECPVEPPKSLPVTSCETTNVTSASTQNNPAFSGQHGMYALADSDESNSSSEDEIDEVQPIHKLPPFCKTIKLEQPKKADKTRKSNRPVDIKEQVSATPQSTPKVPVEPDYEVVLPSTTKGRVIYVKPAAETPVIQYRGRPTQDKLPAAVAATACSMYASDAAHISAPGTNITSDEQSNISYRITNKSNQQLRPTEAVVKSASSRTEGDKRQTSSVDQRRSKEHMKQNPSEAKTSKATFKAVTALQTADDQRRSKEHQLKTAVEEVMEIEDLEEICLPSTSNDETSSDALHKTAVEEVMEVEDFEEICLESPSTDHHQRSRASMKQSVLQVDDTSQSDVKTVEDIEMSVSSYGMERGRQAQRQERRRTKHRVISTADRPRPSVTVMYSTDSGAQNIQDKAEYVEIGRRSSSKQLSYLAADEDEETQQHSVQRFKHREHFARVEDVGYYSQQRSKQGKPSVTRVTVENEQEHQVKSQKQGKQFCVPTASENQPRNADCAQPSVSQKQLKQFCGQTVSETEPETADCVPLSVRRKKKSRKVQSSELLTIEDVIDQVPESQQRSKHHEPSVTLAMENGHEQQTMPQNQEKQFCGQLVSESNDCETEACSQQSVRRKKSRKTQRSELTIEDVIEQVPESHRRKTGQIGIKKELHRADQLASGSQKRPHHHEGSVSSKYMVDNECDKQPVMDEAKTLDDRRRKIRKIKAALEREEQEYRKKLSHPTTESSVEPVNDEETKKNRRRRREVHVARKMLGTDKMSEQE